MASASPQIEPRDRVAAALPQHLPGLDGLRGLAILLVIAHMLGLLDAPSGLLGKSVSYFFSVGWIGVQLFFVLSGFLITGILLDTQRATNYFSGFLARRMLRILPLYYGALLVAFVILPALGPVSELLQHDRSHQVWLWTYLSNWTMPTPMASKVFPHFWSLGVEEQFYFLWPWVVRGRTPLRCVQICIALALASLAARVWMHFHGWHEGIYTFTVSRMDALALGAAAAAALRIPGLGARMIALRTRLWPASLAIGLAGALITHGYALASAAGATIGYTFLSVAFALAIVASAGSDSVGDAGPRSLLRSRPLRAVGKYSYGMYVIHKPLHDFVGKPLLKRYGLNASQSTPVAVVYVLCGLLITFAAAYLSYQTFERHFLGLKNRFAPRGDRDARA